MNFQLFNCHPTRLIVVSNKIVKYHLLSTFERNSLTKCEFDYNKLPVKKFSMNHRYNFAYNHK